VPRRPDAEAEPFVVLDGEPDASVHEAPVEDGPRARRAPFTVEVAAQGTLEPCRFRSRLGGRHNALERDLAGERNSERPTRPPGVRPRPERVGRRGSDQVAAAHAGDDTQRCKRAAA
jgi:hypothetical protein